MPTGWFVVMNVILVIAAFLLASRGWRLPVASLVIPSATLVNAIAFHIIPTIIERRISPGLYTATFLYLPLSAWTLTGAARDGVSRRHILTGMMAGAAMALGVVLVARLATR